MRVTSTELRKDLFRIMERVLHGEFVEVAHKGRIVRLVPAEPPTKMSRLTRRDTVRGTFEDLERAQAELDSEMRTAAEGKWDQRL